MARQRSARRRRSGTAGRPQLAWRQVRNPLPPIEVFSADQIEHIHLTSLRVLEQIGMDFLDAGAREMLRAAGADVAAAGERVRFDRNLVLEAVAREPSLFTVVNTSSPLRLDTPMIAGLIEMARPNSRSG